MGCNTCKEKALKAERERIERSMMNHSSSTAVSDMEYASRSTAGCMVMQDPLQTMERDVVSIYKQARTKGDGVGVSYLNMQKKIREWIKNLPYGCPPDRIDLCKVVDEWLSCQWGRYMRYHRYRIGDKPDISYWGKIIRLQRSLCDNDCGLCPDEVRSLKERVNKLLA